MNLPVLIRLQGLCDFVAIEFQDRPESKPKDFQKTLKKAGKTTYSVEIAKRVTDTTGYWIPRDFVDTFFRSQLY